MNIIRLEVIKIIYLCYKHRQVLELFSPSFYYSRIFWDYGILFLKNTLHLARKTEQIYFIIFILVQNQPHCYEDPELLLHYKYSLFILAFFRSIIFKEIPLWINSQHCRKLLTFKYKFFFFLKVIKKRFLHTCHRPTNFLFNKLFGKSKLWKSYPKVTCQYWSHYITEEYICTTEMLIMCRWLNSVVLQVNSVEKNGSLSMLTKYHWDQ